MEERRQRVTRWDPPVLNQYLYDRGKGKSACMVICVQALYHMSEAIADSKNSEGSLLNTQQWYLIMARGIQLWQLWRSEDKHRTQLFPTEDEVMALPQCRGFYKRFKPFVRETDECTGLAKASLSRENPQGTLETFLISLVSQPSDAYALVTLPNHHTVALVCRRDADKLDAYSLYLFDPHGASSSGDYITLLEFRHYRDTLRYIYARCKIRSIDQVDDDIYSFYSETELMEFFSYSASLFTPIKTRV